MSKEPYDITEDMLAELEADAGEDDDKLEIDLPPKPEPEEEVEAPAKEEEAEEVEEPAAEPEAQYITREQHEETVGAIQAQLEAWQAAMAQQMQRNNIPAQQPQQQQQQYDFTQTPGWDQDPALVEIQKLRAEKEYIKQVQAAQAHQMHQNAAHFAWQSLQATKQALQAQYNDIGDHIKDSEYEQAFIAAMNKRDYSANWHDMILGTYQKRTWDKYRAAADELNTRRKEKATKAASSAAAAKVPSGGATYQPVAHRLDPNTRGYTDAFAAARAELEAMGG